MAKSSVKPLNLTKWQQDQFVSKPDVLAVEEPLEIRLNYLSNGERIERALSVTMRTPGNDLELTLGFLFSEGIVNSYSDIKSIRHCETVEKEEEKENVVKVVISDTIEIDSDTFQRNFYTTSSCGVCGKSSIEAIEVSCPVQTSNLKISSRLITSLPNKLRSAQTVLNTLVGCMHPQFFQQPVKFY